MSKRDSQLFLYDIVISIQKIKHIVSKFENGNDLKYDFIHWDSVIREFEIIGEATNFLIKDGILDTTQRVVVDFRNVLIHEYFGISEEEVWNIAHNFLDDYLLLISSKINKDDVLLYDMIEENKHLEFITDYLNKLKDNDAA